MRFTLTGRIDPRPDDLIIETLRTIDPARNITIPPPPSVDALLAQAHARPAEPKAAPMTTPLTRRRMLKTLAATTTAVGAVLTGIVLAEPGYASPATLDLDYSTAAPRARDLLLNLLPRLPITPADATAAGSATYIHFQEWSIDLVTPSRYFFAHDVQTWWTPDLNGRTLTTDLPKQSSGTRELNYLHTLPTQLATRTDTYTGNFPLTVARPATSPDLLRQQLHTINPTAGDPGTLRSLAAIARQHRFTAAQRAAIIQVLAEVPGLAMRGYTTDRAGRRCIALGLISGDSISGTNHEILLLSPDDGTPLGFEVITIDPPRDSPVNRDTLTQYALYLNGSA